MNQALLLLLLDGAEQEDREAGRQRQRQRQEEGVGGEGKREEIGSCLVAWWLFSRGGLRARRRRFFS